MQNADAEFKMQIDIDSALHLPLKEFLLRFLAFEIGEDARMANIHGLELIAVLLVFVILLGLLLGLQGQHLLVGLLLLDLF